MALVTPPPMGRVPALNTAWKTNAPQITAVVVCNKGPRVSLAPFLGVAAARRLGVVPWTPGRRSAPRQEFTCLAPDGPLVEASGAYARDLLVAHPKGGFNPPPDLMPPFGPPFTPLDPPAGPGPILPEAPLPPGVPPVVVPPAQPPGGPPEPPVIPVPPVVPPVASAGFLRTVNFNFSGNITGGSATSEVRVYGPITRPFVIREIYVNPIGAFELGQILDVVVSGDADGADITPLTGNSIFPFVQNIANLPAPDGQRGMLLGQTAVKIDMAYQVDQPSQSLKVQTVLGGTAVTLPNLHVAVVIEELEVIEVPVVPRPPIVPQTPAPPSYPVAPRPIYPIYLVAHYTPRVELWRVVAQSAFSEHGLNQPLADSYLAWRSDPLAPDAALFVSTMQATASGMQIPFDPNALIPLNQPVTAA